MGSGFLHWLTSCVRFLDCGALLVFVQMAVISDRDNPCLECRQFILSDSGIETLKWPVVFLWENMTELNMRNTCRLYCFGFTVNRFMTV